MGWLDWLGKGLGTVASVAGAPFTGGMSLAALPSIWGSMGRGNSNGGWNEMIPGMGGNQPFGSLFPGAGGGGSSGGGGMPWQFGAGMGLNTLGNFLNAQAGNQVRMIPLPPPNALFPGANQAFGQGITGLGQQSFGTLQDMMKTGMPVDYSKLFSSYVDASGRGIAQGRANLMEKYGAQGTRFGSTMANAGVDYELQNSKNFANILAQLAYGSNEAARGRQMQASGLGAGMFQQAGSAFTPSALPIVGGQSPFGAAATGAGNAFQLFGLMRMLGMGA